MVQERPGLSDSEVRGQLSAAGNSWGAEHYNAGGRLEEGCGDLKLVNRGAGNRKKWHVEDDFAKRERQARQARAAERLGSLGRAVEETKTEADNEEKLSDLAICRPILAGQNRGSPTRGAPAAAICRAPKANDFRSSRISRTIVGETAPFSFRAPL